MSGRSEGRQADTTAIEGSAADQMKTSTKSSAAVCCQNKGSESMTAILSRELLTGKIITLIMCYHD